MYVMRLGCKHTFGFFFAGLRGQNGMSRGNMFCNVRDHRGAALQVFMEKVGTELGINNAARENGKSDNGKYRDDRNKQIRDDEPVPQAPKQPASPPAYKAEENINSCENGQVFDEAKNAAAQAKEFNEQPHHDDGRANNIQPRQAAPNLLNTCKQGLHGLASEEILYLNPQCGAGKRLSIFTRAGLSKVVEAELYCCGALLTRLW